MVDVVRTLMACTDCVMYVANGELPEGDTGQLEAAIDAHLDQSVGTQLVLGDSDHDEEFSWRACECCGSKLGGARHELLILE